MNEKHGIIKKRLLTINTYMRNANLPNDLQARIRRYLEYIWLNDKSSKLDDLLNDFPKDLKSQILLQING